MKAVFTPGFSFNIKMHNTVCWACTKNNQQSIPGQIKTSGLLIGPSWNMNRMTFRFNVWWFGPFWIMTAYVNAQTVTQCVTNAVFSIMAWCFLGQTIEARGTRGLGSCWLHDKSMKHPVLSELVVSYRLLLKWSTCFNHITFWNAVLLKAFNRSGKR